MADSFWPSPQKLSRLRRQGVVPLSDLSLRLAVVLIVASVLYAKLPSLFKTLNYAYLIDAKDANQKFIIAARVGDSISSIFMMTSLAVVACILSYGLLQTRFYFSPGLCSLRLRRLWKGIEIKSFTNVIYRIVTLLIAVTVTGIIAYTSIPFLLDFFRLPAKQIFSFANYSVASPILFLIMIGLLSLVSAGLGYFFFYWSHRMTREEVERESRQ